MEETNENANLHVKEYYRRERDSHRRCGIMSCATSVLAAAMALSTAIALGGQVFLDAMRKGQVTGDIFHLDTLDAGLLSIDVKKIKEQMPENSNTGGAMAGILNLLVAVVSGSLAYSQGREGIETVRKLRATQKKMAAHDFG